jgi:hypothetical protein
MSDVQQLRDDLHFVRGAMSRRERSDYAPPGMMYLWVVYILVGYTLMDFRLDYAGPWFAIGGIVGGIFSAWIGRRYSRKVGESDRTTANKAMLHFFGGIFLGALGTIALATFIPVLRSTQGSQVFVVMIGLVYFLWGVHYQRYFMFLGPIVMAGGVLVGQIHHFGWTILGAVISLGLILPTLIAPAVKLPAESATISDTGAHS